MDANTQGGNGNENENEDFPDFDGGFSMKAPLTEAQKAPFELDDDVEKSNHDLVKLGVPTEKGVFVFDEEVDDSKNEETEDSQKKKKKYPTSFWGRMRENPWSRFSLPQLDVTQDTTVVSSYDTFENKYTTECTSSKNSLELLESEISKIVEIGGFDYGRSLLIETIPAVTKLTSFKHYSLYMFQGSKRSCMVVVYFEENPRLQVKTNLPRFTHVIFLDCSGEGGQLKFNNQTQMYVPKFLLGGTPRQQKFRWFEMHHYFLIQTRVNNPQRIHGYSVKLFYKGKQLFECDCDKNQFFKKDDMVKVGINEGKMLEVLGGNPKWFFCDLSIMLQGKTTLSYVLAGKDQKKGHLRLCFYDGVRFDFFEVLDAAFKSETDIERYFYVNSTTHMRWNNGVLNRKFCSKEFERFCYFLLWMTKQNQSCFSWVSNDVLVFEIIPFICEEDVILSFNPGISTFFKISEMKKQSKNLLKSQKHLRLFLKPFPFIASIEVNKSVHECLLFVTFFEHYSKIVSWSSDVLEHVEKYFPVPKVCLKVRSFQGNESVRFPIIWKELLETLFSTIITLIARENLRLTGSEYELTSNWLDWFDNRDVICILKDIVEISRSETVNMNIMKLIELLLRAKEQNIYEKNKNEFKNLLVSITGLIDEQPWVDSTPSLPREVQPEIVGDSQLGVKRPSYSKSEGLAFGRTIVKWWKRMVICKPEIFSDVVLTTKIAEKLLVLVDEFGRDVGISVRSLLLTLVKKVDNIISCLLKVSLFFPNQGSLLQVDNIKWARIVLEKKGNCKVSVEDWKKLIEFLNFQSVNPSSYFLFGRKKIAKDNFIWKEKAGNYNFTQSANAAAIDEKLSEIEGFTFCRMFVFHQLLSNEISREMITFSECYGMICHSIEGIMGYSAGGHRVIIENVEIIGECTFVLMESVKLFLKLAPGKLHKELCEYVNLQIPNESWDLIRRNHDLKLLSVCHVIINNFLATIQILRERTSFEFKVNGASYLKKICEVIVGLSSVDNDFKKRENEYYSLNLKQIGGENEMKIIRCLFALFRICSSFGFERLIAGSKKAKFFSKIVDVVNYKFSIERGFELVRSFGFFVLSNTTLKMIEDYQFPTELISRMVILGFENKIRNFCSVKVEISELEWNIGDQTFYKKEYLDVLYVLFQREDDQCDSSVYFCGLEFCVGVIFHLLLANSLPGFENISNWEEKDVRMFLKAIWIAGQVSTFLFGRHLSERGQLKSETMDSLCDILVKIITVIVKTIPRVYNGEFSKENIWIYPKYVLGFISFFRSVISWCKALKRGQVREKITKNLCENRVLDILSFQSSLRKLIDPEEVNIALYEFEIDFMKFLTDVDLTNIVLKEYLDKNGSIIAISLLLETQTSTLKDGERRMKGEGKVIINLALKVLDAVEEQSRENYLFELIYALSNFILKETSQPEEKFMLDEPLDGTIDLLAEEQHKLFLELVKILHEKGLHHHLLDSHGSRSPIMKIYMTRKAFQKYKDEVSTIYLEDKETKDRFQEFLKKEVEDKNTNSEFVFSLDIFEPIERKKEEKNDSVFSF